MLTYLLQGTFFTFESDPFLTQNVLLVIALLPSLLQGLPKFIFSGVLLLGEGRDRPLQQSNPSAIPLTVGRPLSAEILVLPPECRRNRLQLVPC
jgi:hypothetical protein